MLSRFHRRRSNLQGLGRLSKSCPTVDNPEDCDHRDNESSLDSSASLSDASSESSDEVIPVVSKAEKDFARQSIRRARQREMEQKRNIQENKISMDDYLGKQTLFRLWLLEEQKKELKGLSSPKRKTYFKMFVRLWNKRHLPAKFYESRLSLHVDEHDESEEKKSPVNPNRPKFSLLQNSPALDPSIFPHTVDLSSDSIAPGTPSSFSTFGKSTPSSNPKSTPLSTPFKFSAHFEKQTKETTRRFKGVFQFGDNKENVKHNSLPATLTSSDHLRTATISPHKKMMSACQERSLDRMVVNWSPRGQPKLNAVGTPRCPSPFQRAITQQQSRLEPDNITKSDIIPTTSSGLSSFAVLDKEYHQVKDSVDSVSPTYAEVPFPDNLNEGKNCRNSRLIGSVAVATGGKGHRRRSRSVDDTPVYAVPSKERREQVFPERQARFLKELSPSPPPLPPKRFDPHVEGLGIPFTPSSSVEVTSSVEVDHQHSGRAAFDGSADGKETAKKSGKFFKGRLPWFGRKLTSRRRSRSCETLSPLSKDVPQKSGNCSQFPLVELERSPTFSRRVLTPHQNTSKTQADKSQKSNTFHLIEYTSSPMQKSGKQPEHCHKKRFELTEYSSSPMRLGTVGLSKVDPEDLVHKGLSRRRRSRSLEQINSPSLDLQSHHKRKDFIQSQNANIMLHGGHKEMEKTAVSLHDEHSALSAPRSTPAHEVKVSDTSNMSDRSDLLNGDYDHYQNAHCEIYECVKLDVKQELSCLVQKIQELSAPEESMAMDDTTEQMEVRELRSSPKRFGQKDSAREAVANENADIVSQDAEDPSVVVRVCSVPCSQDIGTEEVAQEATSMLATTLSSQYNTATVSPVPVAAVTNHCHEYSATQSVQHSERLSKLGDSEHPTSGQVLHSLESVKTNVEVGRVCEPLPDSREEPNTKHSETESVPAADNFTIASSHSENLSQTEHNEQLHIFPEVQSYKEVVQNPVPFKEVAFSVAVGSPKLSNVGIALNLGAAGSTLMTKSRLTGPQRRRSRSVDETMLSKAFIILKNSQNKGSVKRQVSPPSASIAASCFVDEPRNEDSPTVVEDPQNSVSQIDSAMLNTFPVSEYSTVDRSVTETPAYGSAAPALDVSMDKTRESVHQILHCQPARGVEVSHQEEMASVLLPHSSHFAQHTQDVYKNPPEAMEKAQIPSEPTLKPTPSVREKYRCKPTNKNPPQIMAKPQIAGKSSSRQTGQVEHGVMPQKCQSQQSPERNGSPAVRLVQQQFGCSLRSALSPKNRRRSRSVGDVSSLDNIKADPKHEEGGGFASIRAFWDRLRHKTDETEKSKFSLQRTPSTMRRLQQQLFGDKQSCAGPDKVCSELDKQATLAIPQKDGLSQSQEWTEIKDGTKVNVQGKESPSVSYLQGTVEQQVSVEKDVEEDSSQKWSEKLPVTKSPFVTVRRQSSRKRNTGSPSLSNPRLCSVVDSPCIEMPQGMQTPGESLAAELKHKNGCFTQDKQKSSMQITSDVMEPASCSDQWMGAVKQGRVTPSQKKPLPPPRTLPKPNISTLSTNRQDAPATCKEGVTSTAVNVPSHGGFTVVGHVPVARRRGKRRSQEADQSGVPEKVSSVGDSQVHRGLTTRSLLRHHMVHANNESTPKEKACTVSGRPTISRPVKRRSQDKMDEDNVSAVKRTSSDKAQKRDALHNTQDVLTGQQQSPSLTAGQQEKDTEHEIDVAVVPRTNSGKEPKISTPCGNSKNAGEVAQGDLSASKTQSSSKYLPRTRTGRRSGESTGRQACSEKRSGPQTNVWRISSGKSRSKPSHNAQSAENRDTATHSYQIDKTPSSKRETQASCTKKDEKSVGLVKRFNSTREETKTVTATNQVKRFGSLRDDTRSSRAKRRSGGGSQGVTALKRTSAGTGRCGRQSGKVRCDSSRRGKGQQSTDGTASRSGSFRKQNAKPPQSPTFMRITRHLGVKEDDRSEDSFSQHVDGDTQIQTLADKLEVVQSRATRQADDAAGQRTKLKTGSDNPQVPATPSNEQHNDDTVMETDVDCWTEDSRPFLADQKEGKISSFSTLV